MNFSDELSSRVSMVRVMEDLLDVALKVSGETVVRCVNAGAHKDGDATPSASVNAAQGLYHCFACGLQGDVVDLARFLRDLPTTDAAIAYLRDRYLTDERAWTAARQSPPADPPVEQREDGVGTQPDFPFFPDAIPTAQWTLTTWPDTSLPALRAPIYDGDFAHCGWKLRGPRRTNGKVRALLCGTSGGHRAPGLIDGIKLKCLRPGALVFVVAGETDVLAILAAATREGLDVVVVCHSNGEEAPFDEVAACFAGLTVAIVYDTDGPGRRGADKARLAIARHARACADLLLPFTEDERDAGCKDLRDWLGSCGHSVQELVVLANTRLPLVRTATQLLDEFDRGLLKQRPMLVKGLLKERDLLILFGPPGLGKTQLGIALSACLALGRLQVRYVLPDARKPMWEISRPQPVRVLLFSAEDDEFDTAERLQKYLERNGLPRNLDNLMIVSPRDSERDLSSEAGRNFLFRLVEDLRPEVVLIDNLTTVLPGCDKSNDADATIWINAVARRLRDQYGCTVVLYGHASKSGGRDDARDFLERLFGSYAWGAAADGAVLLDRVTGRRDQRRIIHAKARGLAPFPSLTVFAPTGDCVFVFAESDKWDEGAGRTLKVQRAELVAALDEHATRGEHRVERQILLETVNRRRSAAGDHESVGRTAMENALQAYSEVPDAVIVVDRGSGRGDPWIVSLVGADGEESVS